MGIKIHGVNTDNCSYEEINKKINWPPLAKEEQERRLLEGCQFNDPINSPVHYTLGIECADYIESHKMDFFQGNAIKYITRFKHKGKPLEDLKKAKWYVERLIKNYAEND